MNHKRKRPKHQRAGCLLCKPPHKDERRSPTETNRASVRRILQTPTDPRASDWA